MKENDTTPQSTPIESTPQAPLLKKPKTNNVKLLIIVGIIISLLTLGVAGFTYFSQKPSSDKVVPPVDPSATPISTDLTPDVSDWKTYQNEEYGFEFKYPSWYLPPYSTNEQQVTEILEEPNRIHIVSRNDNNDSFTLTVIDIRTNKADFINFNDLNNCDIDKHPGTELGIAPCTIEDPESFMLGGIKAQSLTIQTADTFSTYFIQTLEEPFIEIKTGMGYEAPRELFNQVLSTFKFQ